MTFTFRPATRENVGLWINLIGGTGSGKSFSGMRLASGIAGGKPFAVIDTENRRALHYADQFKFDHAELRAPFRPDAYAEAITVADAAGYPVIVVDSGSHVWSGEGGMLDWQEEELDEMVKRAKSRGDSRAEWQIREAGKMSGWIKPKHAHKQMVNKMLGVRAHLILCLRAEEKIEMVKDDKGKTVIQKKHTLTGKDGWVPLCDKNLPFEATCSFLLLASAPGIPHPIKLQEQHKALFPVGLPITEESGRKLAQWAAGGQPKASSAQSPGGVSTGEAGSSTAPANSAADAGPFQTRTAEFVDLCKRAGVKPSAILSRVNAEIAEDMNAVDWQAAKDTLNERIQKRGGAT